MTREPSTLFAPDVLPGPDGIELLPMPADIRAIYDAAQRNTPFSKDVDDALAAHRNARRSGANRARSACGSCGCHALGALPGLCEPTPLCGPRLHSGRHGTKGHRKVPQGGCLHLAERCSSPWTAVAGLPTTTEGIAGHSVEEVLSLLHELGTRTRVAARIGVTQQAVSLFCKKYELDMPQNGKKAVVLARRKEVRRLSEAGLSVSEMAQQLAVPYACITADRKALKLPPVRLPAEK